MYLRAGWDLLDVKLGKSPTMGGVPSTSLFHFLPLNSPHSPTQLTELPIKTVGTRRRGIQSLMQTHAQSRVRHLCFCLCTSVFECQFNKMVLLKQKVKLMTCLHVFPCASHFFFKRILQILFWAEQNSTSFQNRKRGIQLMLCLTSSSVFTD